MIILGVENMAAKDLEITNFSDGNQKMNAIMDNIVECFNQIGIREIEENETHFCVLLAEFTKVLKKLLDLYSKSERETQLKYKPHILYYRQVQGYLVFLIRFPTILTVRDHDEIEQTLEFLNNREEMIATKYKIIAEDQTRVFDGDFRKKLEEKLRKKT